MDTPAKFPKPGTTVPALKVWWSEWEWLFKGVAVLIALAAAIVAFMKVL